MSWLQRLSHTLGLRVALWYAAVFLLSATAVGWLAYTLLVTSLERRDHELLRVKLAEYADRYEDGGLPALSSALSAEQASGSPDTVLVRLIGRRADVLLMSPAPTWNTFDLARLDDSPPTGAEMWEDVPSSRDETTLEVVSRTLLDGTVIQVGRTTLGRDRFLKEVRNVLGIIVVVVLGAGLVGGVALTQSGLQPLRNLSDTVKRIADTGQLDERVAAAGSGDMVDELGRVFNVMLGKIETLVNGMRGALDAVAHDLRTPVARLRARAEDALSAASTPEQLRDALAECVEEADRVSALLATLMDISEAETGTMHLSLEPVSVSDVAAATIDLYEDTAEDAGVALTSAVPPGLVVTADRQRLQQVLANLVDNAVKYTPAGGHVTIGATRTSGDRIAISVSDTGRGIAPEDIPHIWDRLYRGRDQSHARGLGLGLSLVAAIVGAHGGRADVRSEPGQGSTFTITLAAASPA